MIASAAIVAVAAVSDGPSPLRVAGLAALLALAVASTRTKAPAGGPAVALTLGLAILAAGNGALSTVTVVGLVLMGASALATVARRLPQRETDVLVEACLVGAVVGLGGWALAHPDLEVTAIIVLASDTALMVVAGRLLTTGGRAVPAYRHLNLGIAYLTGSHVLTALAAAATVDLDPVLATSFGVAGIAMIGLSTIGGTGDLLSDPPSVEPRELSVGHLILVLAGLLVAPSVLVLEAWHGGVDISAAVTATLVAGVLVAYVTSLVVGRARVEHRSNHDELTGLPNRELFVDRTERALSHARRSGGRVGVLFIDLDEFKQVNDTFGHAAGDHLLQVVASRLAGCIRDEDTAARLAGDEFAMLLPHLSSDEDVITIAERILTAMQESVTIADTRLLSGLSIGVAVGPDDGDTPDELLASADAAMYRAKEAGRNTYEVFRSELATAAHERLRIETALHRAIEAGELVLHYQPVVDTRTGEVTHCEALVRWDHPDQGMLFPGHFVPVAERSDLVVNLGAWVLDEACRQTARWRADGLGDIGVAVNVSARQFRHSLTDTVATTLRRHGLPPELLILELTESAAVNDTELVANTLADLQEMGVATWIDDFGTGYCGLRYLAELPLGGLKIDRSFITDMTQRDLSIVAATVAMGHNLGLEVVAEGVETLKQLTTLRALGCDLVQGYLYSRPIAPDAIASWVRTGQARRDVGSAELANPRFATVPDRSPLHQFRRPT